MCESGWYGAGCDIRLEQNCDDKTDNDNGKYYIYRNNKSNWFIKMDLWIVRIQNVVSLQLVNTPSCVTPSLPLLTFFWGSSLLRLQPPFMRGWGSSSRTEVFRVMPRRKDSMKGRSCTTETGCCVSRCLAVDKEQEFLLEKWNFLVSYWWSDPTMPILTIITT